MQSRMPNRQNEGTRTSVIEPSVKLGMDQQTSALERGCYGVGEGDRVHSVVRSSQSERIGYSQSISKKWKECVTSHQHGNWVCS